MKTGKLRRALWVDAGSAASSQTALFSDPESQDETKSGEDDIASPCGELRRDGAVIAEDFSDLHKAEIDETDQETQPESHHQSSPASNRR